MVKKLEEKIMAFHGDFEQIDDEIKVKVKALSINDFETLDKINKKDMSREDMKIYVAEDKLKRKLIMDKKDKESDYDSDLNRTMFMEFWRDLDIDFKKNPHKEARS